MEEVAKLSLNSVVSISTPKTMKLKGKIGHQEVIILINCGATHNFISNKVVQQLGPPLDATKGFGVLLDTGLAIRRTGRVEGLFSPYKILKLWKIFYPWILVVQMSYWA